MENNARTVRSYKKTPTLQLPAIPEYILPFLPQSAPSSANPEALSLQSSSPTASGTPLGSSYHGLGDSSTQPRLIQARQDNTQKLEAKFKRMEEILGESSFDSIGEFLEILFYNPSRAAGKDDPRGVAHGLAVARFLQGKTKTKMSDIIVLIYSHKHSAPSSRSNQYHERHAPFSPAVSPAEIFHARPSPPSPPLLYPVSLRNALSHYSAIPPVDSDCKYLSEKPTPVWIEAELPSQIAPHMGIDLPYSFGLVLNDYGLNSHVVSNY